MANVSATIKLDPELKKEAQAVLGRMGLSLSAGISLFLHQVVADNAIPFQPRAAASVSPSGDPYFDVPRNRAAIEAALRRMGHGSAVEKSLEDLKEASHDEDRL